MGCGCGSSFSGQIEKKCSCGKNKGGSCHCSNKSNFSSSKVAVKDFKSRFNSFMGSASKTKVDIKKHNIPQEEFYAYNDYYSGMGGIRSGGFTQWNKNDDLEVQF